MQEDHGIAPNEGRHDIVDEFPGALAHEALLLRQVTLVRVDHALLPLFRPPVPPACSTGRRPNVRIATLGDAVKAKQEKNREKTGNFPQWHPLARAV
jgi:hypothetical protein